MRLFLAPALGRIAAWPFEIPSRPRDRARFGVGRRIRVGGVAAFLGLQKVKKVGKPEKTIESMQELKGVVPSGSAKKSSQSNGMYT